MVEQSQTIGRFSPWLCLAVTFLAGCDGPAPIEKVCNDIPMMVERDLFGNTQRFYGEDHNGITITIDESNSRDWECVDADVYREQLREAVALARQSCKRVEAGAAQPEDDARCSALRPNLDELKWIAARLSK